MKNPPIPPMASWNRIGASESAIVRSSISSFSTHLAPNKTYRVMNQPKLYIDTNYSICYVIFLVNEYMKTKT
jgi:hypothetical protein